MCAQEHYQVIDAVLALGACLYRWPVSAATVTAVILHEDVAAGGFEVRWGSRAAGALSACVWTPLA